MHYIFKIKRGKKRRNRKGQDTEGGFAHVTCKCGNIKWALKNAEERSEKKRNFLILSPPPLVDIGAVKRRPSRLLESLRANDVMQFLEWGLLLDGCGLDGRVAHSVSLAVLLLVAPDGSGGRNKTGSVWLVVLHLRLRWWLVVALATMLVVNVSWRSVTHCPIGGHEFLDS